MTDDGDSDEALHTLLREQTLGTLVTLKRDGRPQLSNVSYTYDREASMIRISTVVGRAKAANVRRDPRVSLLASSSNGWSFAVAEGTAALSAVAAEPDDDAVEELVGVYRAIGGEHPDWDDYRRAMVADKRLVLRIAADRVYGLIRS